MMNILPKQFVELEQLSDWAGASEKERVERRRASSPARRARERSARL